MRHTELVPSTSAVNIIIMAAGVILALVLAAVAFTKRDSDNLPMWVTFPFFAIAFAAVAVGAVQSMEESNVRSSRLAWGSELYGINFTDNQLKELSFPSEEPGRYEQAFGFTDVAVDRKIREVQLYWDGYDFVLLDADGNTLPVQERVTGPSRRP